MKCMKCDTSIEPGERFCIGCGAPVQAAASPAESFCTECGSKLDPGARFCDECGTATEAAVPAEAKSVTSAVPVDSPDIRSPAEFVQKPAAAPVSDFDGTEKTAPPTETADAASTDAPSDGSNEKASSVGTLLGLIVVVAVAGAVAIAVSLQSTKSSAPDGKPSQAANSSQPPAVASQGKAPADKAAGAATNVSGRLLIDAASSGNAEKFQAIFQQLQLAEKPEPGDRAIARKLRMQVSKQLEGTTTSYTRSKVNSIFHCPRVSLKTSTITLTPLASTPF